MINTTHAFFCEFYAFAAMNSHAWFKILKMKVFLSYIYFVSNFTTQTDVSSEEQNKKTIIKNLN